MSYEIHTYDVSDDLIDGVSVARKCNEDPEQVFKTLVTVGNDKEHYVFVIPVAEKLDLKECAKAVGVKSVEMHHEKLDGTGYPYGLKDEEIPMEAKILAVADILSALMEKRSYKEKFSKDRTLDILQAMAEENKIDKNVVRVYCIPLLS